MSTQNSGMSALRAPNWIWRLGGQSGSYGEEADRERDDADEEERDGAEHAPERVAEPPAAAGHRGGDLGLRHCGLRPLGCVCVWVEGAEIPVLDPGGDEDLAIVNWVLQTRATTRDLLHFLRVRPWERCYLSERGYARHGARLPDILQSCVIVCRFSLPYIHIHTHSVRRCTNDSTVISFSLNIY